MHLCIVANRSEEASISDNARTTSIFHSSAKVSHLLDSLLFRLLNAALRALTLLSKFLLIFVLARYLEPVDVGLYGLLFAAVFFSVIVLGFEFYTYSTRQIINSQNENWSAVVRDTLVAVSLGYTIFIPIIFLVFGLELLPVELVYWFLPLVLLEHVAQELNRLLIATKAPVAASIVLFVRSGLWALVVSFLFWFFESARTLEFVLNAWVLGVLSACLLGTSRLTWFELGAFKLAVNWGWIRRGFFLALPFIAATASLRAIYTFDRYWVEALSGLNVLAAYVFYIGIANAIISFLEASVFAFVYPSLVSAIGQDDFDGFRWQMRSLLLQTVSLSICLAVLAIALATLLVSWISNPIYLDNFRIIYWTILAAVLFSWSMIPHFGLYAQGRDHAILFCHISSFIVFTVSVYCIATRGHEFAVPVSMCVAFLFLLISKLSFFWRSRFGPTLVRGQ